MKKLIQWFFGKRVIPAAEDYQEQKTSGNPGIWKILAGEKEKHLLIRSY